MGTDDRCAEETKTASLVNGQLVVIGGGAGGLELAVKLGKKYRRDPSVDVILIDKNPTHIWKPLFHEVATGSLNSYHDEASYRMLARKHHFRFLLGEATDIDPNRREVHLAATRDDSGAEITPKRTVAYEQLVVSVGSESNDFGIEGALTHSRRLDSREQAESFNRYFTTLLQRLNSQADSDPLSVVIVGGGATGVELAADMHNVVQRLREYGFEHLSDAQLHVSILEAAPGLLPRLPQRIGASVKHELEQIGVAVHVNTRVERVLDNAVHTNDGTDMPAAISVWAAGVKAPAWLAHTGLPTDQAGRLKVNADLSVDGCDGVFAIGDCCACQDREGVEVPPRAQAAHQMASLCAHNIRALRSGKATRQFVYRDFGSLVSLSRFSTVGNLMGNLMRGSVFIEGWVARTFYLSLYRMHQMAIHGPFSMLLLVLGDRIYKATRPEVKLH